MKREQKAFEMLMAACMAFAGISKISTASADSFYPTSFEQVQLGNYLPDEDAAKEVPNEIVLPSGRKVIKKSTNTSSNKKTAVKEKEEAEKTTKKAKVIKAKKNTATTEKQVRKSLSAAAKN